MSATANAARLPGVGSKPSGLKTRRPALGAVGALVTLVILELASITGVLPASALPLASKVIVDVFGLLVDLAFLQDVGATLVAWFIGLSIASVFGIALGLVLGVSGRNVCMAVGVSWVPAACPALLDAVAVFP